MTGSGNLEKVLCRQLESFSVYIYRRISAPVMHPEFVSSPIDLEVKVNCASLF